MNGTIGLDRYVSAVSEYNHRTMSTRMALALMGGLPGCLPACLAARGGGVGCLLPAGVSCCVGC
jgi:hypothetical protein